MKSAVETLSPTRAKLTIEVPFEELKPSLARPTSPSPSRSHPASAGQGAAVRSSPQVRTVCPSSTRRSTTRCRLVSRALHGQRPAGRAQPRSTSQLEDTPFFEFTPRSTCVPHTMSRRTTPSGQGSTPRGLRRDVAEQVTSCVSVRHPQDIERPPPTATSSRIDLQGDRDGEVVEGARYRILPQGRVRRDARGHSTRPCADWRRRETSFTTASWCVATCRRGRSGPSPGRQHELPELDDDFAQTASEFDTIETARGRSPPALARQAPRAGGRRPRRGLQRCSTPATSPSPRTLVTGARRRRQNGSAAHLPPASPGAYLGQRGAYHRRVRGRLEKRAATRCLAVLLDEIARAEEIRGAGRACPAPVSVGASSRPEPRPSSSAHVEHNHIPERCPRSARKALARIVEGATVTDASGTPWLNNLRPDGTIGDPEQSRRADTLTETSRSRLYPWPVACRGRRVAQGPAD